YSQRAILFALGGDIMGMYSKTLIVALAAGGLLAQNAHARGPYGSINIGNWKGGAYSNDQTGGISHCAAGAVYKSGIYFVVSINNSMGWTLGFMHQGWTLTNGQAFQIALTFDGQTPFNVQGTALSASMVAVPMPINSALINQFRKA